MASKKNAEDQRVLALLDLIAVYRARIVKLEKWREEVEASWKEIKENS